MNVHHPQAPYDLEPTHEALPAHPEPALAPLPTETTPAIERATEAVEPYIGQTAYPRDAVCVEAARGVLAAALDVEEIARVIDDHSPEWLHTRGGDLKRVWCYGCDRELDTDVDGARHQAHAVRDHLLGGAR